MPLCMWSMGASEKNIKLFSLLKWKEFIAAVMVMGEQLNNIIELKKMLCMNKANVF